MFDISWFWLYYILWYHFKSVLFSLYIHRAIGHRQLVFSNRFSHFCRFWLWTAGLTGPRYVETYYTRHTDHHRYADTKKDPHSPYYMTINQLLNPWGYTNEVLDKSPLKTPSDWVEKNIYTPYYRYGKWVAFIVPGILFGPWGFVLAWAIHTATEPWFAIISGNWAFHKIGFTYEKNKNKKVKARNVFPIGFLFAGEELHANHHNYPNSINNRRRWFEFDIGYAYALLFRSVGWVKFNKELVKENKNEQTTV